MARVAGAVLCTVYDLHSWNLALRRTRLQPVKDVARNARRDPRLFVYEHASVASALRRVDVLRSVVNQQSATSVDNVAPRRDAVHVRHLGLGHVAQDAP